MNDYLDSLRIDGLKPFRDDETLMDVEEYYFMLQRLYELLDEEARLQPNALHYNFELENTKIAVQQTALELRKNLLKVKHYHEQRHENS